jgi:hypothetical protein
VRNVFTWVKQWPHHSAGFGAFPEGMGLKQRFIRSALQQMHPAKLLNWIGASWKLMLLLQCQRGRAPATKHPPQFGPSDIA